MDSVSVEGNVVDVEADSAHVLVAKHTFLSGPLEAGNNRILNFIQVLDTLGDVNNDVRASAVRAKAPDLTRLSWVILVPKNNKINLLIASKFLLFGQNTGSVLGLLARADFSLLDVVGQTIRHGQAAHEDTVVLVW